MSDNTESNPNLPENDPGNRYAERPPTETISAATEDAAAMFGLTPAAAAEFQAILVKGMTGAGDGEDESPDYEDAAATFGAYAASMIVAAAHAQHLSEAVTSLAELGAGDGRPGNGSLSSEFSRLSDAADHRLFRLVRHGMDDVDLPDERQRGDMYRRLTRMRKAIADADRALVDVLDQLHPYVPDNALPAPDDEGDEGDEGPQ